MKESKAMMKKEVSFMKKKGAPKSMIRHEMKEAGMKKGVKRMYGGGPSALSPPAPPPPPSQPSSVREPRMRFREDVKGGRRMAVGGMAYSKGGSASSRADGVAKKGKTKGKMIKMMKGGYCG